MAQLHTGKIEVEIDEEGFLSRIDEWNEEVAEVLAEREGVAPLNETKRKIVHYLRDYYRRNHNFPILRSVCKMVHAPSGDCVSQEFVDPMKAWKIAGLPKPPQVFFTSFDGKHFFANPFY
jgi:tRNA 2-thiouridine synthesizing protein E